MWSFTPVPTSSCSLSLLPVEFPSAQPEPPSLRSLFLLMAQVGLSPSATSMATSWGDAAAPGGGSRGGLGTGRAPEQTAAPSEGLCSWRTSAESSATGMGLIPVYSCQGSPSSGAPAEAQGLVFPAGGARQVLAGEHRAGTLSLGDALRQVLDFHPDKPNSNLPLLSPETGKSESLTMKMKEEEHFQGREVSFPASLAGSFPSSL